MSRRPSSKREETPADVPPAAPAVEPNAVEPSEGTWMAWRLWAAAYKVELVLFAVTFLLFASFSSQRFLRQSAAPHFVYQAQAWLERRLDIDPTVVPNIEDWACVREVAGKRVRCSVPTQPSDRWYVSFPPFPALLMVPFVALHGYQLNDTSFTVILGALAVALFYALLRFLSHRQETERDWKENVLLSLVLGFGSVFFYCTLRGEVWFTAEVLGVLLTCLYVRCAVGAQQPLWAGLFYSMAALTRTPLVFSGVFFLLECLFPSSESWRVQLKRQVDDPARALRKIGAFAAGALPLAILGAAYNQVRFGHLGEFGHRFLYDNRVNVDIDRWGLFSTQYLGRNLEAAFFKWPALGWNPLRLGYDPHGLSLLLTLPFLLLLFVPKKKPRLHWPLWVTVAVCAVPGLFYQNDGYMQFGFRFSLDYTPFLVLLFATGGWSFKSRWVQALVAVGFLVNFWGAAAFRGYTELVRNW